MKTLEELKVENVTEANENNETAVMTRAVVDKSPQHAKPHSIDCPFDLLNCDSRGAEFHSHVNTFFCSSFSYLHYMGMQGNFRTAQNASKVN